MLNFGASKPRVGGGGPWIRTWWIINDTEVSMILFGLNKVLDIVMETI